MKPCLSSKQRANSFEESVADLGTAASAHGDRVARGKKQTVDAELLDKVEIDQEALMATDKLRREFVEEFG